MRKHNEGNPVEIYQDVVVYLDELIKSLKTYNFKFKISKDGTFTPSYWTLDQAIQYYTDNDRDNERHDALFRIKRHLSLEDCILFREWLLKNHPDKMDHWKSHKPRGRENV